MKKLIYPGTIKFIHNILVYFFYILVYKQIDYKIY